jgi:hypothetical protein
MSAHLSRLRLFQRHLRSLVWDWVWVWDWIHSHTPPRTRSPSSRHPHFTHYPFPLRSLVCSGQTSPHKPRLVVSHSTCPPLSSSPHANSFVLGTAVLNTHTPGTAPGTVRARPLTTEGARRRVRTVLAKPGVECSPDLPRGLRRVSESAPIIRRRVDRHRRCRRPTRGGNSISDKSHDR